MNAKIMGIALDDAKLAVAETEAIILIDGLAKDFMSVGKRKDYGFTQDVCARFMKDIISSDYWKTLGEVGQSLFLHRHANASAARQYYEKKGIVARKADDWN